MQLSDHDEFTMLLKALAATFQVEVDSATTTGYLLALSDLPIERINAAVVEAMRTKKFMPKAGELREIAQKAMNREHLERRARANRQQLLDAHVLGTLQEAQRLGRDRAYVERELRRIGELIEALLEVDAWLLAQLGECPLRLEWPEFSRAIAQGAAE